MVEDRENNGQNINFKSNMQIRLFIKEKFVGSIGIRCYIPF